MSNSSSSLEDLGVETGHEKIAQEIKYDVFAEVETAMHIKIAIGFKKIVEANGQDNETLFADIAESDILEIETFARESLPLLIKEDEYAEYYGIFKNNVKAYKIVGVHMKILHMISNYLKNKRRKNIRDAPTLKTNAPAENVFHASDSSSKSPQEENVKMSVGLTEENGQVSRTIKQWLKINYSEDIKNKYITQIQMISKFSLIVKSTLIHRAPLYRA